MLKVLKEYAVQCRVNVRLTTWPDRAKFMPKVVAVLEPGARVLLAADRGQEIHLECADYVLVKRADGQQFSPTNTWGWILKSALAPMKRPAENAPRMYRTRYDLHVRLSNGNVHGYTEFGMPIATLGEGCLVEADSECNDRHNAVGQKYLLVKRQDGVPFVGPQYRTEWGYVLASELQPIEAEKTVGIGYGDGDGYSDGIHGNINTKPQTGRQPPPPPAEAMQAAGRMDWQLEAHVETIFQEMAGTLGAQPRFTDEEKYAIKTAMRKVFWGTSKLGAKFAAAPPPPDPSLAQKLQLAADKTGTLEWQAKSLCDRIDALVSERDDLKSWLGPTAWEKFQAARRKWKKQP